MPEGVFAIEYRIRSGCLYRTTKFSQGVGILFERSGRRAASASFHLYKNGVYGIMTLFKVGNGRMAIHIMCGLRT